MKKAKKGLTTFFLLGFVFLGCKNKEKNVESSLRTTSDRINEVTYTVEGVVTIPVEQEITEMGYIFDLEREYQDHLGNTSTTTKIDSLFSNNDDFKNSFNERHRGVYPTQTNGELSSSAVKHWIHRQLKFTKYFATASGVEFSLKKLVKYEASSVYSKIPYGKLIDVKYVAEINSTLNAKIENGNVAAQKLSNGTIVSIPKFELGTYFELMGDRYINFVNTINLKKHNSSVNLSEIRDLLKKENLINATKNNSFGNHCYKSDGDAIGPFNFFYYFKGIPNDCEFSTQIANLKILSSEQVTPSTTFPEYHRLISDGEVDVFIYYGEVDSEERSARSDRDARLSRSDKKFTEVTNDPITSDESPLWKVSRDINGVKFNITYAVQKVMPTARQRFEESIQKSDVVIYDGHAGYGANISGNFGKPEGYPENKYQIIFLNGCSTYKYGTNEILTSKAIRDFDFNNGTIDLIATFIDIRGHTQQIEFLNRLEEAIEIITTNKENKDSYPADFSEKYSWLGMVTSINKVSDASANANGGFLVTGEQGNDYEIGKVSYTPSEGQKNIETLKKVIADRSTDEKIRHKSIEWIINSIISEQGKDFKEKLKEASQFCKDFAKGLDKVLFESVFYTETCQVKNIRVAEETKVDGLIFRKGESISFHPGGNYMGGIIDGEKVIQIGGMSFSIYGSVSFFANGQIKGGQLFKDATTKWGVKPKDSNIFFYSNGNLKSLRGVELYENGNIAEARQDSDVEYGGYTLWAGNSLTYYQNGKIRSGTVLNLVYQGQEYSGVVYFDQKGTVLMIKGNSPITWNSSYLNGTHIFYPNGQIFSSEMGLVEYQGVKLYGKVTFYPDGKIKASTTYDINTIDGMSLQPMTPISFYSSGKLKSANVIAGNIKGYESPGGEVSFYEDETVKSLPIKLADFPFGFISLDKNGRSLGGTLGQEVQVNGFKVPAGGFITYWNADKAHVRSIGFRKFIDTAEILSNDKGIAFNSNGDGGMISFYGKENAITEILAYSDGIGEDEVTYQQSKFQNKIFDVDGSLVAVKSEELYGEGMNNECDASGMQFLEKNKKNIIACLSSDPGQYGITLGVLKDGTIFDFTGVSTTSFFKDYDYSDALKNYLIDSGIVK